MRTRKKLIEVALPLDAINAASAREKSIRHVQQDNKTLVEVPFLIEPGKPNQNPEA